MKEQLRKKSLALAKAEAYFRELPAHPRERAWNQRHVIAAYLVAQGNSRAHVAKLLGVTADAIEHYPVRCDGWFELVRHFQRLYVARLEAEAEPLALRRLRDIAEGGRDIDAGTVVRASDAMLRHVRDQRRISIELHKLEQGRQPDSGGRGDGEASKLDKDVLTVDAEIVPPDALPAPPDEVTDE